MSFDESSSLDSPTSAFAIGLRMRRAEEPILETHDATRRDQLRSSATIESISSEKRATAGRTVGEAPLHGFGGVLNADSLRASRRSLGASTASSRQV